MPREAGHRRARRSRAWSCALADDGEVHRPRRQRVPRLPRRPRAHRRGARRRRLAPHRRHRRARRRRLPAHRRPQEGAHHHRGRQEHLAGEPRGGAEGAAADRAGVRRSATASPTSPRCSCSTPTSRRCGPRSHGVDRRRRWPSSRAIPMVLAEIEREVDDRQRAVLAHRSRSASSRCSATSGCPTPRSSRRR